MCLEFSFFSFHFFRFKDQDLGTKVKVMSVSDPVCKISSPPNCDKDPGNLGEN